jgi:hypothetical protein
VGKYSTADEGRAGTFSPTHPHNGRSLGELNVKEKKKKKKKKLKKKKKKAEFISGNTEDAEDGDAA